MSCAGLFIGSHIGFDYPGVWLHIDMAAPAHVVCIKALCSHYDSLSRSDRGTSGRVLEFS